MSAISSHRRDLLGRWQPLAARARRGDLEAHEALELLQRALPGLPSSRLSHWAPPLFGRAVRADQRRQAIGEAARWLRDRNAHRLAYQLLLELPWPQESPELYLLKGVLERHLGEQRQALISLAIALAHPPHHGLACYELGELHRSLGQFDQAAAWLLAALRSAPQHHWIHIALQFTRFSTALLPAVEAEYQRHCARHPQDAMALHLLASLQLRLERQAEAIASSRRAVRLDLGPRQTWLAPPEEEADPPDFIIIGVPKGGTSSLLSWLGTHPQLWVHPRKELHFFNDAWEQGEAWYRAQFPQFRAGSGILRGEATPNYFLDPRVPARIAAVAPRARLILLLRDPLQRAISWIEHLRRHEGLQGSTAELLLAELALLEHNHHVIHGEADPAPGPQALLGSCYDPALLRWQRLCSNPMQILHSEDLFAQPEATLQRCARFLGVVADWHHPPLLAQNTNPRGRQALDAATTEHLEGFLAAWNQRWRQAMGTIARSQAS
jgi:tetratricopeptide (TPR) repeat protein